MPLSDQGVNRERYMFIPRTLIFLMCGEKILLIKGAAHKRLWAGKYNGLGGHIEPGESVLAAARRELKEEANLEAPDLALVGTVIIETGQNPGIVLFVLRGECPQGEPLPSSEGSLEWLPIVDLQALPLVEDLPALLPAVLAQEPGRAPFSALYRYLADGKLDIHISP